MIDVEKNIAVVFFFCFLFFSIHKSVFPHSVVASHDFFYLSEMCFVKSFVKIKFFLLYIYTCNVCALLCPGGVSY